MMCKSASLVYQVPSFRTVQIWCYTQRITAAFGLRQQFQCIIINQMLRPYLCNLIRKELSYLSQWVVNHISAPNKTTAE
jgi:hypothetical protein